MSVTPGADVCSAKVGWLSVVVHNSGKPDQARHDLGPVITQGCASHGSAGANMDTFYCEDYTECKNLLHVEDAAEYSAKEAAKVGKAVAKEAKAAG